MKLKMLISLAAAGTLAVPLAGQASVEGDNLILAQAGGPAGASSVGRGPTGGVPSPQSAGEPATQADRAAGAGASTANCDILSGSAKEKCLSDAAAAGASSSGSASSGTSTATGTTGGPGSASGRTGSGSDTATQPGTSGHGKPQ